MTQATPSFKNGPSSSCVAQKAGIVLVGIHRYSKLTECMDSIQAAGSAIKQCFYTIFRLFWVVRCRYSDLKECMDSNSLEDVQSSNSFTELLDHVFLLNHMLDK